MLICRVSSLPIDHASTTCAVAGRRNFSWRQQGLQTVVSLLEDGEVSELGLESEAAICEAAAIRFARLPIPDRGVPASERSVSELVAKLIAELHSGRGVGIHCRIGVGRSALIAACVLAGLGMPVGSAWAAIQRARGQSVPDTEAQRAWVDKWLAGSAVMYQRNT